jgi:carbamoyl-phosphate synthase small subunit
MVKYKSKQEAVLMLEDGTIFKGKAATSNITTSGEICFNTGMTGYQEVFTDPSYFGQILIATNVHIGNYGIHTLETESSGIKIAGLVCSSFSEPFSRKESDQNLTQYFNHYQMAAIEGVDTRALVRYIRQKGAMNAIISSGQQPIDELRAMVKSVPSMEGLALSSKVSCSKPYFLGTEAGCRIAVIDYGVKQNILRSLVQRGAYLKIFPYNTSFESILEFNPDGVMLSNGPGDPSVMHQEIATIRMMLNSKIPIFGICLGHQLLALANGISTYKMFNGHRGINHPVKNLVTGKCEITSQNHGFAVNGDEINKAKSIKVTHINLNDHTIEGISLLDTPAFSVQYHPEASPGPHDAAYLFDDFMSLIKANLVNKLSQV